MIEVNLLKEGHGILYENKKPSVFKRCSLVFCFLIIPILSFSAYGILFYDKEELNTLLYIIDNDKRFVFLNSLIPKEEDIKIPLDDENMVVDGVEVEEVINVFESEVIKKTESAKEAVKIEDKVKPEVVKIEPKPVVLPNGRFEVIAGTCVLKRSAEHIMRKLKKLGFNSYIKNTESDIAMYAVWIGEFDSTAKVNDIKQKLGNIVKLQVVDSNGKYIIKTESVLFSKKADNILEKVKKLDFSGKIFKTKELRKTFTVLLDTFNTEKEAAQLKAKVKKKDKGVPILIAKVKVEK